MIGASRKFQSSSSMRSQDNICHVLYKELVRQKTLQTSQLTPSEAMCPKGMSLALIFSGGRGTGRWWAFKSGDSVWSLAVSNTHEGARSQS